MKNRENKYKKQIQKLTDINFEISMPVDSVVGHTNINKSQLEDVGYSKEITVAKEVSRKKVHSQPTENLDDIIVLKKVNRNHSQKNRNGGNKSSDVVDYNKEKSVLLKSTEKNKKQENKKRKFDPFSTENVGPRAPKKRKSGMKGKSVSFKK